MNNNGEKSKTENGEVKEEKKETPEKPKSPEEIRDTRISEIDSKLKHYGGPKIEGDVNKEVKNIEKKFSALPKDINISEESRKKLQQKKEEEISFQEGNQKHFLNLNREKRSLEIRKELEGYSDFEKDFEQARKEGREWEVKQRILENPEDRKRYVEYKKILAEKFLLDTMPELEKAVPGLDYYITKGVATEAGPENDTQILITVVEQSPKDDPEKQQRMKILKKLMELGLTNSVALGEKFSGNSDRHKAFLDFVFIHKGGDGKYKSIRPEHELLSEEEREVVVGEQLPDRLNEANTFKEISPEDFSSPPSYPEHFRDDVLFNGIYLQGPELQKKLDFFTKKNGLSPEQLSAVEKGIIKEDQLFTPEQAKAIKKARVEQIRAMTKLGELYFGGQMLDKVTLEELSRTNIESINLNHVLGDKTGIEVEKRIEDLKIKPEILPQIEGLTVNDTEKIFSETLKGFIFGHGNGGKTLKNELFAYPNKLESDIPITILANSPRIIEARMQIEKLLQQKGVKFEKDKLHNQVVDFMKEAIARFKGDEDYWEGHDNYELIRKE